jgi:DNA replication protein DnaC
VGGTFFSGKKPRSKTWLQGIFVVRKQNVILAGFGTGKAQLAIGLGCRPCEKGYPLWFVASLATEDEALGWLMRALEVVDLLTVDELST